MREEFRKSQLAAAGFDMIVSKQQGLAKLADAINALPPALALTRAKAMGWAPTTNLTSE